MADRTFWYGRVDPGYGSYRYELKLPTRIDLTDEHDLQDLAELAADDYHSNHDGWEASWPIRFGISATEHGPEMARFEVDRDVEPVFAASRIAGVRADAPASGTISRAADFLEQYAAYIHRVKPEDIEQHPYLPELEQVAADLRAADGVQKAGK